MIDPTINGYNRERTQQFYRDLLERLRSLPGVISAGQAVQHVLEGAESRNGITIEGYTPRPDELLYVPQFATWMPTFRCSACEQWRNRSIEVS
jgi:hypothetical protein